MKKLFTLLIFIPLAAVAQIIVTQPQQLNFGNVNVGDKDSLQLTIQNQSSQSLNVTNVKFYTTYNDFPFSASQNNFTLAGNSNQSIWVYFEPTHNILHNSELIIQHNATSGVTAVDLRGQGVFPNVYYNITQNLSEQALKNALHTRLGQAYNQRSYSQARDAMYMTIDNKKNNGQNATINTIECVYTGYNKSSYTSRSNAQTTSPQFNTEHTFPQSKFSGALPMRSDIHHLFPTTNNSNSQRGSKPFGNISNGTPVTLGGGSFYTNTMFEPRNAQKGKTARAMMYFVIRYADSQSFFSPQENILRAWHNTYPVDSVEIRRNDDIYAVQNNRNPFVDYPQLEERITNFVTNSVAPQIYGMDILQTSINFGTILSQTPDTFNYILVNRGNQDLMFSNFSLSDTSFLSFASGSGVNDTIPPGEDISIAVIANTPTTFSFNETLDFNTNLVGPLSSLSIPINGQSVVVGLEENKLEQSLEVFPNPIQDRLYIRSQENDNLKVRLLNAQAQTIQLNTIQTSSSSITLNTENLAKGVYFLEVTDGYERVVKRLVK
jgi:hypothetical protein